MRASVAIRRKCLKRMAGWTGLEPAASGVTGRRYNQLNYHPCKEQFLGELPRQQEAER